MSNLATMTEWTLQVFRETPWTGWLILAGAIFVGVAAGRVAQTLLRALAGRLEHRNWHARGLVVRATATPASLMLITFAISVGLTGVKMSPELQGFSRKLLAFLFTFAVAWFLFNLIDLLDLFIRRLATRTQSKIDDAIVPLVRRTAQIFVVVVFLLFTAQNIFNADIGAWLAGLGVAGLAVSLAAQDTIKNIFGSITIYMDHMFTIGERIVFDGHDGKIEEIGMRSTRIRTLDGNLAIIPNAKFVDNSVLNIGRRPHVRRDFFIGVAYDTPPDKVEQAVQIIEGVLNDPEIASAWTEKYLPHVGFENFAASSLDIRVVYFFHPGDYWKYLAHAQKVNLRILRAFAEAKIEIAFPTQTLYLAGDPNRKLSVEIDGATTGSPRPNDTSSADR